jgi:hypothetical protein
VSASEAAQAERLRQRYDQMRAELEALMAQPVRQMRRIDRLVDALERVQLELKAALGMQGNNPNE